MTYLSEAILALRGAEKLLGSQRLPRPMATELLVQSLGFPEARKGPPPKQQLEVLRQHLLALYSRTDGDAERRVLRDAPWLLWNGEPRLSSLPRLLSTVYLQSAQHQRTFRNLIEAWISGFDVADPTILDAGSRIGTLLESATDRRLEFWRKLHERVAFFNAAKGPPSTAQWLLSGPEEVSKVLSETGLNDPVRGSGGYTRAVQGAVITGANSAMRSLWAEQALARTLTFVAPDNKLRFPDKRGELARGLTSPWRDRGAAPIEQAKSLICDFLVHHLKDPRTHPGNWQSAGEETTSLVRQWLVRASLDMFFVLIAQFALDTHWQWRAAFWKACMDRCSQSGVPFDAWVALGPQVAGMARGSTELRGAYGQVTGAGVQGNHSVLLMRVGPVTLCDWSHNGSLRAWPNEWKDAPRLYQSDYQRSELTRECLDFPPNRISGVGSGSNGKGLRHSGSEKGHWQDRAAELLSRRAGVRLTSADWQP